MTSERTDEFSEPPAGGSHQAASEARDDDTRRDDDTGRDDSRSEHAAPQEATVLVRGETIGNKDLKPDRDSKSDNKAARKPKPPPKEVSEAKVQMQRRLPALDDDADVGVQKEHIVTRDGKADLAFTGTLLASAAPACAPSGQWQEYRIYQTIGGKHVFSKVNRTVFADERDNFEADVFDPTPSSAASQLLRSAREIARSRPLTWEDAAVSFFGYDPLAKALYRKLNGQFEERIS